MALSREGAIHDYLDRNNANPKPFVWTKTAKEILSSEARAKGAVEAIISGH